MSTKIDSREQNGWTGIKERKCAGGGNVTVRETYGGVDPWDFFPWPLYSFLNNKFNSSAYNNKLLLDTVNVAAYKCTLRIYRLTGGYELLRNRNNRLTPFADDRWSPVGTAPTCSDDHHLARHGRVRVKLNTHLSTETLYFAAQTHNCQIVPLTAEHVTRIYPQKVKNTIHTRHMLSQRGVMPKCVEMNKLLLKTPENRGSYDMKTFKNGKNSTTRYCDHPSIRTQHTSV